MAEACDERISIENRRFCSNGVTLAQNFTYKGSTSNHSLCSKTRIKILSFDIRLWAQFSFVLSQCTLVTHRQADRRTERHSEYRALHYMQSHGKNIFKTIFVIVILRFFSWWSSLVKSSSLCCTFWSSILIYKFWHFTHRPYVSIDSDIVITFSQCDSHPEISFMIKLTLTVTSTEVGLLLY